MLAISDGGSTKADWKIMVEGKPDICLTTTGFNPNYDSPEKISAILTRELDGLEGLTNTGDVHYYGTGCWDPSRKKTVHHALSQVFPHSKIHVYPDLLGAARATCGKQPGITCILGTGSNSVLYDGKDEMDNVTNLGFLLGDEGSGSHIGKELIKAYFYREMPKDLQPILDAVCPNGKTDILDKVYGGGVPAAYLAGFAGMFHPHRYHPFVWNLIKDCFREFFRRHLFKYDDYKQLPIHFVGSIAFHFQEILQELIRDEKLNMGKILQKPIEELTKYHVRKSSVKNPFYG